MRVGGERKAYGKKKGKEKPIKRVLVADPHGTTGWYDRRGSIPLVPCRTDVGFQHFFLRENEKRSETQKFNRRFSDHQLGREKKEECADGTWYDRRQGSPVVPCDRTVPGKSQISTEGLTNAKSGAREAGSVNDTRYDRGHKCPVVSCGRTVPENSTKCTEK